MNIRVSSKGLMYNVFIDVHQNLQYLSDVHQPQKFPDFVTKITELESEKIELLKQIMEERVAENIKLRTRIKNKIDIIDAIAKFKPK